MENTSGVFPLLHRVLVKQAEVEIKKGAIYIPDDISIRDEMAQVEGVVIAVGPEVFSDQPNSSLPKAGDVVLYAKLAGFFVLGDDGCKYRIINDLDLVAVKGVTA